jgi:hypothetical protein
MAKINKLSGNAGKPSLETMIALAEGLEACAQELDKLRGLSGWEDVCAHKDFLVWCEWVGSVGLLPGQLAPAWEEYTRACAANDYETHVKTRPIWDRYYANTAPIHSEYAEALYALSLNVLSDSEMSDSEYRAKKAALRKASQAKLTALRKDRVAEIKPYKKAAQRVRKGLNDCLVAQCRAYW